MSITILVLKSTKHIQMMLARMLVGVAVVENYHLEIIHLINNCKALDTRKQQIITFSHRVQ